MFSSQEPNQSSETRAKTRGGQGPTLRALEPYMLEEALSRATPRWFHRRSNYAYARLY